MLFLWVFGRNVELAMGSFTFACYYLLAGMAAGVAQAIVAVNATVPTVGASGAIAAVMGAYLMLYPRAQVRTLVFPPIVMWFPAWAIAGGWALVQVAASWKSVFAPVALDGGVASMAHFAGFAIGIATGRFFGQRRNPEYTRLHGDDATADVSRA